MGRQSEVRLVDGRWSGDVSIAATSPGPLTAVAYDSFLQTHMKNSLCASYPGYPFLKSMASLQVYRYRQSLEMFIGSVSGRMLDRVTYLEHQLKKINKSLASAQRLLQTIDAEGEFGKVEWGTDTEKESGVSDEDEEEG